jgi:hypothetical protein
MSTAPRVESELGRRYQIRVDAGGAIRIVDTRTATLEQLDGVVLFSTHEPDVAEAILPVVAWRSREGDGWIVRCPWSGSLRDRGDLMFRLAREYAAELGRRGASWE